MYSFIPTVFISYGHNPYEKKFKKKKNFLFDLYTVSLIPKEIT